MQRGNPSALPFVGRLADRTLRLRTGPCATALRKTRGLSASATRPARATLALAALALSLTGCEQVLDVIDDAARDAQIWTRHTIDSSRNGADGVKLGDANADGLVDLAVPWEESGRVVVYFNPGPAGAAATWPAVVVGRVPGAEDAVFVDLDDDGRTDVVSCSESENAIYVHWAPPLDAVRDAAAWPTEVLPASRGRAWLFCQPAQIDARRRVDLVAGSKGDNGVIGYFAAPATPRDLDAWRWNPLADADWVMSIITADINNDGDTDIVYSDRKGAARGVYWLDNPQEEVISLGWRQSRIGATDAEAMFLDVVGVQGNVSFDLIVATNERALLRFAPLFDLSVPWVADRITWPETFGTGKAVRFGDIDLDGVLDIVFSCENAGGDRAGIGWLTQQSLGGMPLDRARPISGPAGSKFDLVQLVDLDGDGDLDVITTEESDGLGVVWYENPTR